MIVTLAKRGFPLRMNDTQQLAYQFATKKGIRGFSDVKGKAGYKWFRGFLRRNQKIRIRKPEALSANRAAGFNRTVVNTWFQKYQDTIDRLGLENVPDHIWNCDETGLQDHFLSTRVVAEAGSPCFEISAGAKGETSTCLYPHQRCWWARPRPCHLQGQEDEGRLALWGSREYLPQDVG